MAGCTEITINVQVYTKQNNLRLDLPSDIKLYISNFEMDVKVNCMHVHKVLITAKLLCRECQIDMKW